MFAKGNLFLSSQMRRSIVQALYYNKTYGYDKNILQEQRNNEGV